MEMVKVKVTLAGLFLAVAVVSAQDITWEKVHMDASRVGASIPDRDNVGQAFGRVEGDTYYAPNGKVYTGGSLPDVARIMIEVQPAMAPVKEILGYTTHVLPSDGTELQNMVVDRIMATAHEATGLRIDAGVTNRFGIRYDMPEGKVIADDIISMLPFKNYICVVSMNGKSLREKLERMAANRVEALGGIEMTVKDGHIKKVKVGGRRLCDNRIYNVATIDFLLEGGDGIAMAKDAVDLIQTDVLIREALIDYLNQLNAEGKPISYDDKARVKFEGQNKTGKE